MENNTQAETKAKSKKFELFMEAHVVPVLNKIAGNRLLGSLMEGFYSTLPIIVFSSIIGIIMWVPPAIMGNMSYYPLDLRRFLNRIYVLSMGFVSLWFAMAIASSLATRLNHNLNDRKMNILMVGFAAGTSIMLMSVAGTFAINDDGTGTENFSNVLISNLGAVGMLSSIIVGLTLPYIFYLPVKYGWTIKLPRAVPQGVSQSFADIIPYGLSTMFYWGFGYIFIYSLNETFTDWLFALIKPIFNGLDSYGFLAAVAFMTAFIWFIGVHGPSVTRPFLTPFMYSNLADNQAAFAQGQHPHWALTYEFAYDFTSTLGGTGATFVIPILFILLAKSKKLKAVGIASYIPIWFQVNEPALFGAPMILNPIFAIPFFILPVINILIYKFFIEVIGMNGAISDVPWSLPAIFGLLIGTGFDWKCAPLWLVMVTIDFFGYIPFVLLHDKMCCKEEVKEAEEKGLMIPYHYNIFELVAYKLSRKPETKERYKHIKELILVEKTNNKNEKAISKQAYLDEIKEAKEIALQEKQLRKETKELNTQLARARKENNQSLVNDLEAKLKKDGLADNQKTVITGDNVNVLVICYGAGTSAMLAEQIKKAALLKGIKNIVVNSAAQGTHADKIKIADIVIASPQVKMYVDDFKKQIKKGGVVIPTKGEEYVAAVKDPEIAIGLVVNNIDPKSLKYDK
ncbi:PTS transporter subunit EIIC [Spiroplasma endosymbiont of Aspidapion aeneum]|uniref:PTS transporter subunit EIIC n=1 Tax=Spiroplasma endosymbiont of Aspidapion aeneum TaxID=3066276 RepID=UPI00313AB78C